MSKSKFPILGDAGTEEILIGNEAFVRGMYEAGVEVAAAYPGSPTSEIGVTLSAISEESGIYFEFSTNEKVALELAASASIGGVPACTFMKSVGLNVASDSFVQLSKFTLKGGLVIILGDDPGPHSSQNEQDNRYYARLAKVPLLEPSNSQEAKDMIVFAMELSQKWKMPVVIRSTTRICHGTGMVKFGAKKSSIIEKKFEPDLEGGYIPLPGTLRPLRIKSLNNLKKWEKLANEGALIEEVKVGDGESQIGIITSGHTFAATLSALRILGVSATILKLGIVYPLPMNKIVDFLQRFKKVKILEELDPFLEDLIKVGLYERKITGITLLGKSSEEYEFEEEEWLGEYDTTRLVTMLAKILDIKNPIDFLKSEIEVPARPPQLCPGCGHRTSFMSAKEVIEERSGFSMADIGCYSLGYLPPYNQGLVLYSMGSGVPSTSGMSKALPATPLMSFIGDSTLFHAGLPGIINAVWNRHKQVLMVMDNGITAMTGHQPNPNTGKKSLGAPLTGKYMNQKSMSIDSILEGIGVKFIKRVPAYDQKQVTNALNEAFDFAEKNNTLAVVIQEEPCALMRSSAERRAGTLANPFYIDHAICRNIQRCLTEFACPAIEEIDEKVEINVDLCIGCGCCVQNCPLIEKPIKQMEDFKRV
ncbi:MAG: indolepyruvate ferredoxin oxidoreductase [Candidatus Lokiarchaeota archaeon]|nr:indolepyruvate ferredoxin oxidoreductase [Candidatus Lokiarchaeota archaeon]